MTGLGSTMAAAGRTIRPCDDAGELRTLGHDAQAGHRKCARAKKKRPQASAASFSSSLSAGRKFGTIEVKDTVEMVNFVLEALGG